MWRKEEQQRLEQVENVKSRAEELEAEKERLVRNQIVCREINSPSNNQLQYIIYTEMKLLILKLPDLQDFLNAPYTTLSLPRMMSATLRMERRSAEVEACSESFSNARSDCVKIQVPAYHYVQSNLPMPSSFRISSIRRIGYIYHSTTSIAFEIPLTLSFTHSQQSIQAKLDEATAQGLDIRKVEHFHHHYQHVTMLLSI